MSCQRPGRMVLHPLNRVLLVSRRLGGRNVGFSNPKRVSLRSVFQSVRALCLFCHCNSRRVIEYGPGATNRPHWECLYTVSAMFTQRVNEHRGYDQYCMIVLCPDFLHMYSWC
jgi:hypothetical protein